jgi:hypothetical protein
MTDETKHGNTEEHGTFEYQDLKAAGILYFLLTIGVVTVLCMFGLKGLYNYLDAREKASQPPVNPLVTNVPTDTRHIAPGYPQSVFPSPRLEVDERGQLNGIRLNEEQTLYSYGWVDEKAGTVRIPIDRAMGLLVQRGLPVRPQATDNENTAAKRDASNTAADKTTAVGKGGKK